MAREKETVDWDKFSELWAIPAEVNRDRDQHPEPYSANTIHPYRTERGELKVAEESGPKATAEDIRAAEEYASRMNRAMEAPDEIVSHVIRNV